MTLKGRVNHKGDVAVSAKLPVWGLENLATLIHGVGVSNAASKDRKVNFGWQLDLNI